MGDGLGLDAWWDEPYYKAARGSFSTKGAFILRKLLRHDGARFVEVMADLFFGGIRVARIGGAEATAYVAQRQREEAANGTVNRELAVLTKMLRLAYEHGQLFRVPVIRKLKEAAPREGFCEPDVFGAIRTGRCGSTPS